ncbi:unnamed protein product, partial [Hymenolepis diminuta]
YSTISNSVSGLSTALETLTSRKNQPVATATLNILARLTAHRRPQSKMFNSLPAEVKALSAKLEGSERVDVSIASM